MSMQSEGKDAKGRNYDQATKDGSSSAGSMGAGGTGDIGRMSGEAAAGNSQSDARTDDVLTPGTAAERHGFRPSEPGALETGLEGIGNKIGGNAGNQHNDWGHSDVGAGNKQSESRLDDVVGSDTGHLADEAGAPESGGQRTRE